MGFTIEQFDTTSAPESFLRELSDYYEIVESEELPGDPPTPTEMRIARWRNVDSHFPTSRWIVRDEDGIAASAATQYETEQNLDLGYAWMFVRPDKRGRGYARAMARPAFDLLEGEGRSRFHTMIEKDRPTEDLGRKLGLAPAYESKRSRLSIPELDTDLMDSWIARASERAADYELQYYQSPLPEEMLEPFCNLFLVMNTAPKEDLEAEDEDMTPEHWREIESNAIDSKCQIHTLIAVHRPSGDLAGFTQIKTQDLQPDLGWQEDTGVDPGHRDKGLGRWLKAAMIERITGTYPELRRVDTFNAGSNEPMLNINVAMGFKPIHISRVWQGELAIVRQGLKV